MEVDLNNKIIICPKELKKVFLFERKKNPYLNFSMYTLEDLLKDIYPQTRNDAMKFLLNNTKYRVNEIDEYLKLINHGINKNVNEAILDIYTLLEKNKLFAKADILKYKLNNKDVYIYGYSKENIELNRALKYLKVNNAFYIDIKDIYSDELSTKEIYEFKTIDDEVRYVLNLIAKEVENGNTKIGIICDINEYKAYLDAYSYSYNLKLRYEEKDKLIDLAISKQILSDVYYGRDIFESIKAWKEILVNPNDVMALEAIETIINRYLVIESFGVETTKSKTAYENLKYFLSHFVVKSLKFNDEILVNQTLDFNPSYKYYVIGASDTFLPSLAKNNKILDDVVLSKNGVNSSSIKNLETEERSEAFLMQPSLVFVSYHKNKGKDKVYHTNFIKDDEFKTPKNLNYDYSYKVAKAYLSKAKDIEKKYNVLDFDLNYEEPLIDSSHSIEVFDTSFSGIEPTPENKTINFSYSSMSDLFGCPFKYYIKHILHLDVSENSFPANLGSFVHKIFEYVPNMSFEDAYKLTLDALGEDLFNDEQKLYLEGNLPSIKDAYERMHKHIYEDLPYKRYEHEYKVSSVVSDEHPYLQVNGKIDNLTVLNSNEVMILDFKTGGYAIGNDESYEHGLDMQLLVYSYLLSKDEKYKDYNISGMYFYPVIERDFASNSEAHLKAFSLDGISLNDEMKALSIVKAKKLKPKTIDEYREIVEQRLIEAEQIVRESKFSVNPNQKADPCKYCDFKNVCFKKYASENRFIEKEEEVEEDE